MSGEDLQQPHDVHCVAAHEVEKEEKGEPLIPTDEVNSKNVDIKMTDISLKLAHTTSDISGIHG